MGDVRVISTADALCGFYAFQHDFQPFVTQRCKLCWKFLVSLEPPNRYSLLVAVIPQCYWLALNAPKSLGVTISKKPGGFRSGDHAGQLTGPPHPIHCSPKVWFNVVVPHHAWTTCVVVDEEVHVSRVVVNLSQNKKLWEELITYFPLIRHASHRKWSIQQFFYCCVCILCRGNVFTEPLSSNNGGGGDTHTDTEQDDLIRLLLFIFFKIGEVG
jgi:hypothetical protein